MTQVNGVSPYQPDSQSRIGQLLDHITDMQEKLLKEHGYVACMPPNLAYLSAMELERLLNTLTFKYLFDSGK